MRISETGQVAEHRTVRNDRALGGASGATGVDDEGGIVGCRIGNIALIKPQRAGGINSQSTQHQEGKVSSNCTKHQEGKVSSNCTKREDG